MAEYISVTGDELKLGWHVRLRTFETCRSTPLSGARAGKGAFGFLHPRGARRPRLFHFQEAALLGGNPDCDPDADEPMITSDTKITARSIVSSRGYELGKHQHIAAVLIACRLTQYQPPTRPHQL
jgi:hypothetical protein